MAFNNFQQDFDTTNDNIEDCLMVGSYNNAYVSAGQPLTGYSYAYDVTFAKSDPNNPNACYHQHLYGFLFTVQRDIDQYLLDVTY